MTTLSETQARQRSGQPPHVNVGSRERLATGLIGGLLVLNAVRKISFGHLFLGLVGGSLAWRAATGHCRMYNALGINTARKGPARPSDYFQRGIHLEVVERIGRGPEDLFGFWRNFENLPRIMSHLQSVHCTSDRASHWVAKAPAGTSVEWDAEIINEEPNRLIAWRSCAGADVHNAGSVRFLQTPHFRGTEVHVVIDYIPPAGKLGAVVAQLFGQNPQQQIRDDLARFKRFMETGEIPQAQSTESCC